MKNVAADANSVSEDVSESGVVEVLKRVGGFQGCLRNLVINDRVYRFGLEPAGDSLQGFDIGKIFLREDEGKKWENQKSGSM